MPDGKQIAQTQPEKKNGHKPEPAVLTEPASEFAGVAEMTVGLIDIDQNASMQTQATRLGDARLQTIQRQTIAKQIGQAQGNCHLQRVMAVPQQTKNRTHGIAQPRTQGLAQTLAQGPNTNEVKQGFSTWTLAPVVNDPPDDSPQPAGQNISRQIQRGIATQPGAAAEQPEEEGIFSSIASSIADPKKFALKEVASFASDLPGYHLLTTILGRDPITDKVVKRTPKLILKEALGLIPGGEKIFQNLEESGAIDRAFAWLEEQWTQLQLTWESIKGLFTRAWDSFSATDLIHPIDVWEKIKGIFLEPIGRIANFMIAAGKKVLEFVFEAAMEKLGGSQVLALLKKAGAAFQAIIQDPIGFLSNLITGVKQGFLNFVANIGTHIKHGLVSWLFGQLAQTGIELPKAFDMPSILSMVMQVLGLTWPNIRTQAVKVLGEKVVGVLEGAFKIFTIIKEQGLGGLWEYVKEQLSNLKEMVLGSVKDMVITQVIQAGVQWVLSLLGGPVGALIKAVKGIYDIVMWLIDNGKRIMSLVDAVVDSFGAIASGAVGMAAKFIEEALANAIPTAIGFLASLLGIGDLGNKIKGIITKVQEQVQKGIGWVLTKAKAFAMKVIGKVKGLFGKKKPDENAKAQQMAREQVEQATQKPFKDESQLKNTIGKIEKGLIPAGLHTLQIASKKGQAGQYNIIARAKVGSATVGASPGVLNVKSLKNFRPKDFSKSVKVELSVIYPEAHLSGTIKILYEIVMSKKGKPYDRQTFNKNHMTAYSLIRDDILKTLDGASFQAAASIISNASKGTIQPKKETEESYLAATKELLKYLFNDVANVHLGDAKKNQEDGSKLPAALKAMEEAKAKNDVAALNQAKAAYLALGFDPEPIDYFYDKYKSVRDRL